MDIAALLIACFAAVIAALSFGWQIATWALEGRRVRLVLKHGARGHRGAALGSVKRSGSPVNLQAVRAEGFTDMEVLGVTVTNVGRVPVTVSKYSVAVVGSGLSYTPLGSQIGPELPLRIEAGESETWYADMQDVRALVESAASINKAGRRRVRMTVELGTGDVKRTRRRLFVPSPGRPADR